MLCGAAPCGLGIQHLREKRESWQVLPLCRGWGGGCGHVAICLTSRSHMRCHPGQPRYRDPLRSAFCAALTSSPTKTSRKV